MYTDRPKEDWLTEQRGKITVPVEHAALDPFRGYRNAIRDEPPDTVAVLDAFHVVKLAGNALDEVRRRVQQATLRRRGHKDDPLYRVRRTLLTGVEHLPDRQRARLDKWLPLGDLNSEVEVTWHVYQRVRSIYTATSPAAGRKTAEGSLSRSTCSDGWTGRRRSPGRWGGPAAGRVDRTGVRAGRCGRWLTRTVRWCMSRAVAPAAQRRTPRGSHPGTTVLKLQPDLGFG
ncbi:MAG TPA: transposase [Mycobacteriales bacterium]|nr:transposase [Mycobacteriales bacterium]